MHRLTFVLLSAVSIAACSAAPASARASVVLKLQGNVVRHDANDRAVLTPLGDGAGLGPGETIRYVIVASNSGTSAALHLVLRPQRPCESSSRSTAARRGPSSRSSRFKRRTDSSRSRRIHHSTRTCAGSAPSRCSQKPRSLTRTRCASSEALPARRRRTSGRGEVRAQGVKTLLRVWLRLVVLLVALAPAPVPASCGHRNGQTSVPVRPLGRRSVRLDVDFGLPTDRPLWLKGR